MSSELSEREFDEKFTQMKNYLASLEEEQITNKNIIINNHKEISKLKVEVINLRTNLDIKEDNLNQSKEIIADYKENIIILEAKKEALEKENGELNKTLLDLNQKVKKCNNLEENVKNELNLICKLDEFEAKISKLEFDKKSLESKISEINFKNEMDIKLLKLLKKSELSQKDKIILAQKDIIEELQSSSYFNSYDNFYKNDFNSNNNSTQICLEQIASLESELQNLNEEIFNLKKENANLSNKLSETIIQLNHKENIIDSLQNLSMENLNDYANNLKEMQSNYHLSNKQLHESNINMEKLISDNKKLIMKNEELYDNVNKFNEDIELAKEIYLNKLRETQNYLISKKEEYKKKIKLLKMRVDELYEENLSLKKQLLIGINCVESIDFNLNNKSVNCNSLSNSGNKSSINKNIMNNLYNHEKRFDIIDNDQINLDYIKKNIDEYKKFLRIIGIKLNQFKDK